MSRAEAGEPEGLAILAACQSRGRGSRGRRWESLAGNLHLSALLRPGPAAVAPGHWALLAGVALAAALAPCLEDPGRLALKYPNDLLVDGAKLAGVLVDAGRDASGRLLWLVMGFGVNLAAAPDIAAYPTTTLADHGSAPSPEALAPLVLASLAEWHGRAEAEGAGPVLRARLAFARAPVPLAARG